MRNGAVIIETRDWNIDHIINGHMRFLPGWELEVIKDVPIKSMLDYNLLLTNANFWDDLAERFDKVLIFQHDSRLLREGIDEFMEWDYVGAPWKWQQTGGNGGLSLRTPKVMFDTCIHTPYQGMITHGNEDVYFSNNIHRVNGKLAPREVCSKFSVECIFELGTLGYHAIHKHLNSRQVSEIINQYNPKA